MKNSLLAVAFLALTPALLPQRAPEAPITAVTPKVDENFPLAPAPASLPGLPPATTAPAVASTSVRAFSPETSARISAGMPKNSPVKTATVPEEQPDLREIDKPRNGIIRLPQVLVQQQKLPVLKERDLLTPEGKLADAYKRRPALHFGSLPFLSNNAVALSMREEELRLERMAESTEMLDLYRYSDPKAGAALSSDVIPLFMRPQEWINYGGSHAIARQQ